MKNRLFAAPWLVAAGGLLLCVPAAADSAHAEHAALSGQAKSAEREKMWRGMLARPPLSATAVFDARGRLWLATVKDGHVRVSRSDDRGRSFSVPVPVNAAAEPIAADGENRPKIAVTANGRVYVSWVQSLEQPFSGNVRFAVSRDGGRTFSAPVTVNDNRDIISHRFETLGVDRRGRVHLVWLDKRDQRAAETRGGKYTGAAIYHAVSNDEGASFSANEKIADHSCECCRVALAIDTDGTPVIFWRHIFGDNIRDHALQRLDGKSAPARASRDDWAMDVCPHHGPALAIDETGVYHLAWFTGAAGRAGLYYSRTADRGGRFSSLIKFGNSEAQAAHPQVLSLGQDVWLAWKEFDGRDAVVRSMHSSDAGRSWSEVTTLATASGASDHPLLIADGANIYLSWYAAKEGYRLIEIRKLSTPLAAQEIKPFESGSLEKIVAAHKTRPLVLAFWSLACPSCLDELALLGDVFRGDRAHDLILVSTDSPEETAAIATVLAQHRLTGAEAWVFADAFTERLRYGIDRQWQGELPRTYLYGVDGTIQAVSGKLSPPQLRQWIERQTVSAKRP